MMRMLRASEESVGSDAVVASSCGGACGEDWDGDAPGAEGVSLIGKWRQDRRSAAHGDIESIYFGFLRCELLRFGTPGTLRFEENNGPFWGYYGVR